MGPNDLPEQRRPSLDLNEKSAWANHVGAAGQSNSDMFGLSRDSLDEINEAESAGDGSDSFQDESTGSKKTSGSKSKYRGLTPEETMAIKRLRFVMIMTLVSVAILISVLVYYYLKQSEIKEFEAEFAAQGSKLVEGFRDDSFQKMQALDSLSVSLTNYAESSNLTWPFVTIRNSHEFLTPYLSLANAASIKILPIVGARQRIAWEEHVKNNQGWVDQDLEKRLGEIHEDDENPERARLLQYFGETGDENRVISPYIKNYVGVDTSPYVWTPWWQYAPVIPNRWFLNFNKLADGLFYREVKTSLLKKGKSVISKAQTFEEGLDFQSLKDFRFTQELLSAGGYGQYQPGEPIGYIHYPVFETLDRPSAEHGDVDDPPVAIITATVYWKSYFQGILPENTNGIVCVVENDQQAFTYLINGGDAIFVGMEDMHDEQYESLVISAEYKSFETGTESVRYSGVPVDDTTLTGAYRIRVYPSQQLEDIHTTSTPWLYAAAVMLLMLFAISIFILYDWYVERRQNKVNSVAVKSDAIITSLFPAKVRDQLFNRQDDEEEKKKNEMEKKKVKNPLIPETSQRNLFLSGVNSSAAQGRRNEDGDDIMKHPMARDTDDDDDELNPHGDTQPIADLFVSCTVLFMDIAGFTAWSSTREPKQVFVLLETIYQAFDKLANQRKVFKVETIGDCYVAVCGLPEPCDTHALNMAKFARDCMEKMNSLVHRLEPKLGPDTGDLNVRAGLHSGPVTAGVLRGDRARFQLFGDTVNTAARMESTGEAGKIQISRATAELVSSHGKRSWVRKRKDKVKAKGKGELQTFWLLARSTKTASRKSGESLASDLPSIDWATAEDDAAAEPAKFDQFSAIYNPKVQRLVDYSCDILLKILKKIEAKRAAGAPSKSSITAIAAKEKTTGSKGRCVEEVVEIIDLPPFDAATQNLEGVDVSPDVALQLRDYIATIARSYKINPFHNFEHAIHVVQSSSKLLSRIVAAQEMGSSKSGDCTFGIANDPLTQFAVIFAALIHDVDHRGVPNAILAKEDADMTALYTSQALAEQNSVWVAWNLLMEPSYAELRAAIYNTESGLDRFRQLVVNSLMATDIFDPQLKSIREKRWKNAFYGKQQEAEDRAKNRKATIVIEHLLQASDVCHTMQHWHVYEKWNQKLYFEMFRSFYKGRTDKDPTPGWYDGELWFFDNYVIPLAKKLKDCGVFGVSSDEYLNYALENRREWEKKGKAIVEANHEKILSALEASNRSYAEEDDDAHVVIAEPVGGPEVTYDAEEVEETEYSLSEEPLKE